MRPELKQTSDAEYLTAISRGDEDSLAALYDRYSSILFSLAQRILNDRPEAEDILQEVFLQVWKNAAKFDETRGRAFTWLAVMTRSRALDRLRSLSARRRVIDEDGEVTDRAGTSDAAAAVKQSEDRETVGAALAQLPENQRDTLLLAYFDGLSQMEIAQRTGVPLGTIKSRTRSAMMRLRELLSRDEAGDS